MVRSLTWLLFSLFFGVLSPFTLLYKVTTKLYNENGNDGGYGEFLIIIESQTIITDNSLFTSHDASHEYDAHNFSLYRGSSACDDHDGHTSKQAHAASRL